MKITLNKIASVTKNAQLPKKVEISDQIISEEGAILAVEILDDKKIYNQLELPNGRMSTIQKGDIIAVALGNRSALKGFVGIIPETLKPDNIIQILNIGGVSGICTSENLKEVGHAISAKVIGAISKNGKQLNIKDFAIFKPKNILESKTKLIVVSGTCMHVGKTTISCEILKQASKNGLKISATKLAGVACLKDTEKMKDYGAISACSFIDAGLTSTAKNGPLSVKVTKGAIDYLSKENPDYIIIEFGDGIFGEYGVMEILKDPEVQKNIICHIGCAHDPMGASKLVEVCQEIGAPVNLVSGPVSDNSVGTTFIKKNLNTPAYNAISQGEELFNHLLESCLK
ncbi:MAG: hypothetical protein O3B47_04460 [bacterium]|nr:hypothetical protein [bacterium]